ncbi:hypothetical protein JCM18899A_16060 [Nocardioides sp. AN3]
MAELGRPVLRPGWHAVRFDDHHLIVGLDAPTRALLTDSPDVHRLVSLLQSPRSRWERPTSLPALRALEALHAADLIVDAPASQLESRVAAVHGPGAAERVAARRAARVSVDALPGVCDTIIPLLRAEGIEPVTSGATLTVVVAMGPVRRESVDVLMQQGRSHLVVSGMPTGWEVGPFVVPGRTACLRCVDAALADDHPRRPLVVNQLARRTDPVPTSPALQAAALALAAREVVSYVDGDLPSTVSASLLLPADGGPVLREWPRHALCGCAWDVVLVEE